MIEVGRMEKRQFQTINVYKLIQPQMKCKCLTWTASNRGLAAGKAKLNLVMHTLTLFIFVCFKAFIILAKL